MSRSPRGISPTDKRVKYLMKAKANRAEKNIERKSATRFNFNSSQTSDWAANGTVIPPPLTGNRAKINPSDSNEMIRKLNNSSNVSAFKKRNMTFDAGDLSDGQNSPSAI